MSPTYHGANRRQNLTLEIYCVGRKDARVSIGNPENEPLDESSEIDLDAEWAKAHPNDSVPHFAHSESAEGIRRREVAKLEVDIEALESKTTGTVLRLTDFVKDLPPYLKGFLPIPAGNEPDRNPGIGRITRKAHIKARRQRDLRNSGQHPSGTSTVVEPIFIGSPKLDQAWTELERQRAAHIANSSRLDKQRAQFEQERAAFDPVFELTNELRPILEKLNMGITVPGLTAEQLQAQLAPVIDLMKQIDPTAKNDTVNLDTDYDLIADKIVERLVARDDAELGDRPGNRLLLMTIYRTLGRLESREPSKRRAIWETREIVKRMADELEYWDEPEGETE